MFSVIILSVVMLSVIMPNVVILNVTGVVERLQTQKKFITHTPN